MREARSYFGDATAKNGAKRKLDSVLMTRSMRLQRGAAQPTD